MSDEERLRSLYAAFNARDIDTVLGSMSDEVDWPNAWEGGRLRGKREVREYWTRQWAEIDPRVEPVSVTARPDGTAAVDVHQTVRTLGGDLIGDHRVMHVYTLRNGLITRMDVEGDSG